MCRLWSAKPPWPEQRGGLGPCQTVSEARGPETMPRNFATPAVAWESLRVHIVNTKGDLGRTAAAAVGSVGKLGIVRASV